MDMSFFARTGQRLAPPRLDYPTLLAALRAGASASDGLLPERGEAPHIAARSEFGDAADDLKLAAVILGRPGWRQAAKALGCGFAGTPGS